MTSLVSEEGSPGRNVVKGDLACLLAAIPPTEKGGARLLGAAVAMGPLRSEQRYRDTLSREFNAATAENAMKWGSLQSKEGEWNFDDADYFIDFCEKNGLAVKGHALVWHNQYPAFLDTRSKEGMAAETLLGYMEAHIKTVVGRYKGRVRSWDVLNEVVGDDGRTLRKTMFTELVGEMFIPLIFQWAHEADPDALLFYNDYSIDQVNPKSSYTFDMLKKLVDSGVPVHGVGLQGHLHVSAVNVESIVENIRRFSELGLLVNFSEVDVRICGMGEHRLALQQNVCRQLFYNCFMQPRFEGFTFWGFTDKHSCKCIPFFLVLHSSLLTSIFLFFLDKGSTVFLDKMSLLFSTRVMGKSQLTLDAAKALGRYLVGSNMEESLSI